MPDEPEPSRSCPSAADDAIEDIIGGRRPPLSKCWEPGPIRSSGARTAAVHLSQLRAGMHPADVMPGPDGKDYCAACYPEEESERRRLRGAGFSAPNPSKERKRVARVRKVVKQHRDDEHIERPRAFGGSDARRRPAARRASGAGVRTVVHERGTTGASTDLAFGRQSTRADRERDEHG